MQLLSIACSTKPVPSILVDKKSHVQMTHTKYAGERSIKNGVPVPGPATAFPSTRVALACTGCCLHSARVSRAVWSVFNLIKISQMAHFD